MLLEPIPLVSIAVPACLLIATAVRCAAGLRAVLVLVVEHRGRVRLEREKRKTLIETLERLPGGWVADQGPDGWQRIVYVDPSAEATVSLMIRRSGGRSR